MKLSISISNCSAKVATNVLPFGNVMIRVAGSFSMVAGSFSARLQITNDHVAPVSNIADTSNSWVLIGNYKRLYCVLTLLSFGESTFPAYLISTGYISFLILSLDSCLGYSVFPSYYWAVDSSRVLY